MTYFHKLQGLRAIAIIFVLLAHGNFPYVEGGFIGVDVFFVLSGFLITRLLINELTTSGTISFINFASRRFKRLLPVLLLFLVISTASINILLSSHEARNMLSSSPFVALWSSNFYFNLSSFGYFDNLSKQDIFLHTWSLSVEEQFYLFWPLCVLIIYKSAIEVRGNTKFIAFFSSLIILSFSLCIYWSITNTNSSFYMMPSRVWQFSLGALVFCLSQFHSDKIKLLNLKLKYEKILFPLGIISLLFSLVFFNKSTVYPYFWSLIPSVGAFFIIYAIITNQPHTKVMSHDVFKWIGDRSYSIYLWHWPLFILAKTLGFQSLFSSVCLIFITLIFSALSYKFIEYPFWKGRYSTFKPRWILLIGVSFSLIISIGLYQNLIKLNKKTQSNTQFLTHLSDLPSIYQKKCDTWYTSSALTPCFSGDTEDRKIAILFGDSIGAQWFSGLSTALSSDQWTFIILTKSACPIVDQDIYYNRIKKTYNVCSAWRTSAIEYINQIKPDALFIGSSSSYSYTNEQWLNGTSRILTKLSGSSQNIFIIPGTPNLGFDGPSCISRPKITRKCESKSSWIKTNHIEKILSSAAKPHTNIKMLPLNDLVCPNGTCNAISENKIVVFRDNEHLTDSFANSLSEKIKQRISLLTNKKLLID